MRERETEREREKGGGGGGERERERERERIAKLIRTMMNSFGEQTEAVDMYQECKPEASPLIKS